MDTDPDFQRPLLAIYGRNTNGSLGRRVTRNNLGKAKLIILSTCNTEISLQDITLLLIQEFQLNYITAIVVKTILINGMKIFYAWVDYNDELSRFKTTIQSSLIPFTIAIGRATVHVKISDELTFGTISTVEATTTTPNPISNYHFTFFPNHQLSPSHNLLLLINTISSNPLIIQSIAGIQLKLNYLTSMLCNYGSLIICTNVNPLTVTSAIKEIGADITPASFCSYILPTNVVFRMRTEMGGDAHINDSFLAANILHNVHHSDGNSQQDFNFGHLRSNNDYDAFRSRRLNFSTKVNTISHQRTIRGRRNWNSTKNMFTRNFNFN